MENWDCGPYIALLQQLHSINLNYILVSIANKTDFSFKHVIRIHMYFENDVDFNQMGTVFTRNMVITQYTCIFFMQMHMQVTYQQLRHTCSCENYITEKYMSLHVYINWKLNKIRRYLHPISNVKYDHVALQFYLHKQDFTP